MDADSEIFLKTFKDIVNKIYEEKILPSKRTTAINKDDVLNLQIELNLLGDDSQKFIDSL